MNQPNCLALFSGLIILLPIVITEVLNAQSFSFRHNGYGTSFIILQRYPSLVRQVIPFKEVLLFNLSRLRLRSTVKLWTGGKIRVEYEWDMILSPDTIPLSPFYDRVFPGQLIDTRWLPLDQPHLKFFHFLDRCFFQQRLSRWRFVIGRQRISWGAGRIWRPMDLLNPLNPLRFDKVEREGVDALLVQFFPTAFTILTSVYNPEWQGQYHNVYFHTQTTLGSFDIAGLSAYYRNRWLFAGMITGNLGNAAFHLEGVWDPQISFAQLVVGIDQQLTTRLYSLIEILYNHPPPSTQISIIPTPIFSPTLYRGRWYTALTGRLQLTDRLNGTALSIHNWSDRSGLLDVQLEYELTGETTLRGGIQLPYGKALSEFGLLPLSFFIHVLSFFALP